MCTATWNKADLPRNDINKPHREEDADKAISSRERKGTLVVKVTDSGAGLSKDNLKHLFKEGLQFHANQLQAGQGSGLGLYISKGVVDLHGGRLHAESEGEGCGCSFIMELPLFHSNQSPFSKSSDTMDGIVPSNSRDELKQATMSCDSLDNLHKDENTAPAPDSLLPILLVDDSALNRKMLGRLLRAHNVSVVEAADGLHCLEYMNRIDKGEVEPVQIILMDYEMPRLNGPDTTQQLRALGCGLPIIGITGNVLPEDTNIFLKAGAT